MYSDDKATSSKKSCYKYGASIFYKAFKMAADSSCAKCCIKKRKPEKETEVKPPQDMVDESGKITENFWARNTDVINRTIELSSMSQEDTNAGNFIAGSDTESDTESDTGSDTGSDTSNTSGCFVVI